LSLVNFRPLVFFADVHLSNGFIRQLAAPTSFPAVRVDLDLSPRTSSAAVRIHMFPARSPFFPDRFPSLG